MSRPWAPEIVITPDAAKQLIESQFPQLIPVELEFFGKGWDNSAFLVNQEYVFRFPRRQMGADCMASEIAVLPKLAANLSLSIKYLSSFYQTAFNCVSL